MAAMGGSPFREEDQREVDGENIAKLPSNRKRQLEDFLLNN
jgi:hypothetical protein